MTIFKDMAAVHIVWIIYFSNNACFMASIVVMQCSNSVLNYVYWKLEGKKNLRIGLLF